MYQPRPTRIKAEEKFAQARLGLSRFFRWFLVSHGFASKLPLGFVPVPSWVGLLVSPRSLQFCFTLLLNLLKTPLAIITYTLIMALEVKARVAAI